MTEAVTDDQREGTTGGAGAAGVSEAAAPAEAVVVHDPEHESPFGVYVGESCIGRFGNEDDAFAFAGGPAGVAAIVAMTGGAEGAQDDAEGPSDDEVTHAAAAASEAQGEGAEAVRDEGATPEELEAMRKKLDKATRDWRKRVESLMGDQFQYLVPCELCAGDVPGFHFPPEFLTPETDLEARLIDALLATSSPELLAAANVRQCEGCAGLGKVLTGSRVAGKEKITCPTCFGYGFTPPPTPAAGTAAGEPVEGYDPATASAPVIEEDVDLWGSPRLLTNGEENPNYGRMPQYKHPELP